MTACDEGKSSTINAVLIEIDRSQMITGNMYFSVKDSSHCYGASDYGACYDEGSSWNECVNNAENVGLVGTGGVFNCGVAGTAFTIDCWYCSLMSIIEI